MRRSLLPIACMLLSPAAHAADLRLSMPTGEKLVFTMPDDWRGKATSVMVGQPQVGRMVSGTPRQLEIIVSPLLAGSWRGLPTSRESVFARVQDLASKTAAQAVEKQIPIEELGVPGADGYYFFATDRAPKRGEFKYMLQGMFVAKDLTVAFTALMNGDPDGQTDAALAVIRSVRRE